MSALFPLAFATRQAQLFTIMTQLDDNLIQLSRKVDAWLEIQLIEGLTANSEADYVFTSAFPKFESSDRPKEASGIEGSIVSVNATHEGSLILGTPRIPSTASSTASPGDATLPNGTAPCEIGTLGTTALTVPPSGFLSRVLRLLGIH